MTKRYMGIEPARLFSCIRPMITIFRTGLLRKHILLVQQLAAFFTYGSHDAVIGKTESIISRPDYQVVQQADIHKRARQKQGLGQAMVMG